MNETATVGTGIVVVKVVTDVIKSVFPKLTGRWTQFVVLVLSAIWGVSTLGIVNIPALLTAVAAVFTGAIAADQVIKKEV